MVDWETRIVELSDYLTAKEAASKLGCSGAWVRVLCQKGDSGGFPGAVQIGRMWLIPKGDIEKYIREDRRPGNPYFKIPGFYRSKNSSN